MTWSPMASKVSRISLKCGAIVSQQVAIAKRATEEERAYSVGGEGAQHDGREALVERERPVRTPQLDEHVPDAAVLALGRCAHISISIHIRISSARALEENETARTSLIY